MLALMLVMALQAEPSAIDTYRDLTAAERPCAPSRDASDVTVCGLRTADRFRVPFVVHDPGDPLWEPVPAERERYLARTDNCEEKSIFLIGCGSTGITVTARAGGEPVSVRPMAK